MKGLSQMGGFVPFGRRDLRLKIRRRRTRKVGGNGVVLKASKFEFDNVNGGILILERQREGFLVLLGGVTTLTTEG